MFDAMLRTITGFISHSYALYTMHALEMIFNLRTQSKPASLSWKDEIARRKADKLTEKETILDDTMPRSRSRRRRKDTMDMRSRDNTLKRKDDHGGRRDRSKRDSYDDRGRGRKGSRNEAVSDDEGYRSRRRRRRGKRDSWSDYDSDYEDQRKKRRGKRRGPTNIDDFDEDDFSDSDSYSSDYSDSSSGSDSDDSRRRRRRRKLRSSASVSELTGTAWALSGQNGSLESIGQRIKVQQAEIKKQLATLTQLQKETGMKALPEQQQSALQKDLEKLEQLQAKLRYKPDDQSLQMQLLGQQMLLCEHLKEAQQLVISRPGLANSMSGQNIQLQMIQQQQQALAEHQRQLLFDQQRQMQAEQQRQMLMAAEQQRQMQMAQLSAIQSPQFVSPQQTFGMGGMPQMYSPYSGTVGYY